MDDVDKWFAETGIAPGNEDLYSQLKEVARPFIDKWMADPLADHHTLHNEMKAAIAAFLNQHNPK